jgi:amidase
MTAPSAADLDDALALAERIRRRELSALEACDAAIARIERLDPQLNAVVRKRFDAARAEARALDALPPSAARPPLAGVPFLVKDLVSTLAGSPTGSGNRVLAARPMPRTSTLVQRWQQAGLIVLGQTNTPEFGLTPTTEPLLTGPTRNPWDPTRTAGGSSGGSAAAVAAGMVPLASGGDGGGSIRIPASCCGLFGLKPSRGATPSGPDLGELWSGLAIEHVLTRSVRDSAAVLDLSWGEDGGAPYAAPPAPPGGFLRALDTPPAAPLRVALLRGPLLGQQPVHADCIAAQDEAARLLAELGHRVEEAALPLERQALAHAFVRVLAAETWADIATIGRLSGRGARAADYEPTTYALGLLGRHQRAGDLALARRTLQQAGRTLGALFERCDLLLTPTLGTPPPPLGTLRPKPWEERAARVVGALGAGWLLEASGMVDDIARQTFDFIPFTPLANICGTPAASLPLSWNAQGLPIGVQLMAALGRDALLLQACAQLERARPWGQRRPAV